MSEQAYAAVDLELTGLKPGLDEIIEVGIVRCTPDSVVEQWSSLVRPLEMPSLRIRRMTGISLEELEQAPTWDEVVPEVHRLLTDATLIGHNLPFDVKFLEAYAVPTDVALIDTLPLAQILDPAAPSHRLGDLCQRHGIALEGAHRALADAEAARQIYLEARRRFSQLPTRAREDLMQVAGRASFLWPTGRVLRAWSQEEADSTPQPSVGQPRRRSIPPLEPVQLPAGSLAELTEAAFASADANEFEQRPEQIQMARDVAHALQHGGTLIVEAGTGTGKSLAYLVPASLWALKTGHNVLISTHTINLQQQLEQQDVELARQLIAGVAPEAAKALRATVVKGRDNYLCQQHLDHEMTRAGDWDEPTLLARAAVWRHTSERADRAELRLPSQLLSDWERLSARRTPCLGDMRSIYNRDGSCFLLRAQRQASNSHIVIANHALLVRFLANGAATMPPDPAVVIVDEAHALEEVATAQLTTVMSEAWCTEPLQSAVEGTDSLHQAAQTIGLVAESLKLKRACSEAEYPLARFFDRLAAFVSEYGPDQRGNDDVVTLSQGARNSREWSALEAEWVEARQSLSAVVETVEEIAGKGASAMPGDSEPPEHHSLINQARNISSELGERMAQLSTAVSEHSVEQIAWATRERRRSGAAHLNTAPLSVAATLKPLWQSQHATILTGATLGTSVDERSEFSFLQERLGIDDADTARYGSPFDYQRRCRIYLPVDAVAATDYEHHDVVAEAVLKLSVAAGGRTMVLFRSYGAMEQVSKRVERSLTEEGLVLIRQGRDGRPAAVVDLLKHDHRAVLFGVAALWTGVDVPGEALSQLIITRLPFAPPTDPVLKARGEQYENEFMEFSLPAAILQFRQGVGRLIRTQTDLGAIVVLDNRIVTRRYGEQFIDALPPAPVKRAPLAEVVADVRRFLPSDPAAS